MWRVRRQEGCPPIMAGVEYGKHPRIAMKTLLATLKASWLPTDERHNRPTLKGHENAI